jgi:hypothetical protein
MNSSEEQHAAHGDDQALVVLHDLAIAVRGQ